MKEDAERFLEPPARRSDVLFDDIIDILLSSIYRISEKNEKDIRWSSRNENYSKLQKIIELA